MIKVIVLTKRKPGMPMADFKDYYENHHSVCGQKSFPYMSSYKRKYLTAFSNGSGKEDDQPFDCVTEACFETEQDYQESIAYLSQNPAAAAAHVLDEENLFDRSRIWSFIVEECSTDL